MFSTKPEMSITVQIAFSVQILNLFIFFSWNYASFFRSRIPLWDFYVLSSACTFSIVAAPQPHFSQERFVFLSSQSWSSQLLIMIKHDKQKPKFLEGISVVRVLCSVTGIFWDCHICLLAGRQRRNTNIGRHGCETKARTLNPKLEFPWIWTWTVLVSKQNPLQFADVRGNALEEEIQRSSGIPTYLMPNWQVHIRKLRNLHQYRWELIKVGFSVFYIQFLFFFAKTYAVPSFQTLH